MHRVTANRSISFRLWTVLALLAVMEAWLAAAFPRHSGYVNDFAALLDERSAADIERGVRSATMVFRPRFF